MKKKKEYFGLRFKMFKDMLCYAVLLTKLPHLTSSHEWNYNEINHFS